MSIVRGEIRHGGAREGSPLASMTWLERLQQDEALQAFVLAEIARAGIRLDTLEYQNACLRRDKVELVDELERLTRELRTLRRRMGRQQPHLDGTEAA